MKKQSEFGFTLPFLIMALLAGASAAQEATPTKESLLKAYQNETTSKATEPYSPPVANPYPRNVYWGDTHLHTALSMDAGAFGARLEPDDAYRFARGEEVTTATHQRAKLARPLDFLAVADHSDNMGWFPQLLANNPKITDTEQGEEWYLAVTEGTPEEATAAALEIIDQFSREAMDKNIMFFPTDPEFDSAWQLTIDAAEEFNDPGLFTAFIGYEWTSQQPPGQNLHRVVIFRDGAEKATRTLPFTTYPPPLVGDYPEVSRMPEKLWEAMAAYEQTTGGSQLAIPHNGNLSNGWMFPEGDLNPALGEPLTRQYVEDRARWEPLYEVTQIKGDGETHSKLSEGDDFADYGTWDQGNLNLSEAKTDEMLQREYARSALETGLLLEKQLGTNPYRFGMIGSTDSHTALATADEDNFFGKHAGYEPTAGRWEHLMSQSPDASLQVHGWEQLASGYAAVWATGNTREELFDAMLRKEVYATTGTRPQVRFFAGWDFTPDDATSASFVEIGYDQGVPMGGDLQPSPTPSAAPTFLVSALMDPDGAYLDRVQIIKGWIGENDERQEWVYDIAVSDGRTIGPNGKCLTRVGSTVDIATATWTNTIGDPQFNVYWQDPDFDPQTRAFYYVRVLEIPTPRWTNYDAVRFDTLDAMVDEGVDLTSQERAYTSPVWYSPPVVQPHLKAGS